jgi:hypothetical protein
MKKRPILFLAVFLLGVGLLLLIVGNWPSNPQNAVELAISPEDLAYPAQESLNQSTAVTPNQEIKTVLTVPSFIRLGDESKIKLFMLPENNGKPVNLLNDNQTYNLVIKARLETDGFQVAPEGEVFTALQEGQPVEIQWEIRALSQSMQPQTLWLYISFTPNQDDLSQDFIADIDPSQETDEQNQFTRLLAAPQFNLNVVRVFGLPGKSVRFLGGVCSFIGLVLVFVYVFKSKKK